MIMSEQRIPKSKLKDPNNTAPNWMTTFSDLMSLLLTFFVLLLSMASLDQQRVKEALGSLRGALGVLEQGTKTEEGKKEILPSLEFIETDEPSARSLVHRLNTVMGKKLEEMSEGTETARGGEGSETESEAPGTLEEAGIKVGREERGVVIRLEESFFFDSGSADVKEKSYPILDEIAKVLKDYDNTIMVEGHTDNVPIRSRYFSSNWELSTARALSVLKFMSKRGQVDPQLLCAVGYGEYRPILPNDSPENKKKNRRVEIVVLTGRDNETRSGTQNAPPSAGAEDGPIPDFEEFLKEE